MAEHALTATYRFEASPRAEGIEALLTGQTIGNPTHRTVYDTPELIGRHKATLLHDDGEYIEVAFPMANFGRADGINLLMSVLLGGQCDIQSIQTCRLVRLELPYAYRRHFQRPRYGIAGLRKGLHRPTGPLLGAILKPKIGLTVSQLADLCGELALGGVDIIKEDEVLGEPASLPLVKRIAACAEVLAKTPRPVMYMACVTGDGLQLARKARQAVHAGATALHVNIWCSLGAYADLRRHLRIPLHFQRSGDRVWTTGPYSLSPTVLYQLASMIGCDTAHVGMLGGYADLSLEALQARVHALRDTWPSFSCGLEPSHVPTLLTHFGQDILLMAGGTICGHPQGPRQGAAAFREVIDATVPH